MVDTRLPFDVLGHIFDHYVDEETIFHPLETLLLVCKGWHRAALGHRALWGKLRIYLGHNPTSKIWLARLPLRLARSGTISPLFITLHNCLRSRNQHFNGLLPHFSRSSCPNPENINRHCPCFSTADQCVEDLLVVLAGQEGQHCSRWKQLDLDVNSGICYLEQAAAKALSYPTPKINYLILKDVFPRTYTGDPILFPEIGAALSIELSNSPLPSPALPILGSVTDLIVFFDNDLGAENFDILILKHAIHLKTLMLQLPSWLDVTLPTALPDLQSLSIAGNSFPKVLETTSMPNVSSLICSIHSEEVLSQLFQGKGLPFTHLNVVCIFWCLKEREKALVVVELLRNAIRTLTGLTRLSGDRACLAVIIKLLWEAFHDGEELDFYKTVVMKNIRDERSSPCKAIMTPEGLCIAAGSLRLPLPSSSWSEILDFIFGGTADFL